MNTFGDCNYSRSCFKAIFKYAIILAAYSFLVYKLLTFDRYPEFFARWNEISAVQFVWLLPVFLLMPVNWFLEALKWQRLVSKFQRVSILSALKAILTGIVTGFFTPNRVGDLVGRVMFLDKINRMQGVSVGVVNSLTQNLIISFFGLPAAVLFFWKRNEILNKNVQIYLLILVLFFVVFGLIYFLIPAILRRIGAREISNAMTRFFSHLSDYSSSDLMTILLITLVRYIVFCTQFFFILTFFGIQLTLLQASIAIPLNYLFVTFTPSIAFSEAAIRGSYAVMFVGAFSDNEVSILFAGVSLWLLNFVLPMVAGSVILAKKQG